MSEIKYEECSRCGNCGSEDVVEHKYRTFSYWFCRKCQNETHVSTFFRLEEFELPTGADPFTQKIVLRAGIHYPDPKQASKCSDN